MKYLKKFLLCCMLLAFTAAAVTAQEAKNALLIANGDYARDMGSLKEPIPEARSLKSALESIGFNVTLVKNANLEDMQKALAAFKAKTLTQEGSKKKGSFGKTDVLVTWGLAGSAHQAYPTLRFDYQFITPQRPYFILANATVKGDDDANCPAMRIAISPAQCQDILGIINEQALSALIDELRGDYDKFDITESGAVKDIEDNAQESDDPAKEEEIVFDTF